MPRSTLPPAKPLNADEARSWLVSHLGLASSSLPPGAEADESLLLQAEELADAAMQLG